MDNMIAILLALIIPALAMFAGHWFPWRKAIGRDLTRLEAYAYGVGWIVGIPCIIFAIWQQWNAIAVVIVAAGGAGAATLSAYAIDNVIEQRHRYLDEQDKSNHAGHRNTDSIDLAD